MAIKDGKLIAGVRIWPVQVETGGRAIFAGPVAVTPEARGSKLGLKVTSTALQAAREDGWQGAILIGAPEYFGQIGFRQARAGRLIFPGPQNQARVLVADLAGDASIYAGIIRGA